MLFQDEFDLEDMRGAIKFIHTDEIRQDRVYTSVVSDEYAARVTDIASYDAVSKVRLPPGRQL